MPVQFVDGNPKSGLDRLLVRYPFLVRREHGAEAAGLYLDRHGVFELEAAAGKGLPAALDGSSSLPDAGRYPSGEFCLALWTP